MLAGEHAFLYYEVILGWCLTVFFRISRAINGKNCAVFHTNVKFGVLIPATIYNRLMHQSIPSANSPRQPPWFCTYFQPGSLDLYQMNCPGVARGSALLSIINKYQVVS